MPADESPVSAGIGPATGNPVGALHLPHIPFPKLAQQDLQLLVDVMELGRFWNHTDWNWITLRNLHRRLQLFCDPPGRFNSGRFLDRNVRFVFWQPGLSLIGQRGATAKNQN